MAQDEKQCEHPECTCSVGQKERFCSTACAEATDGSNCPCGHLACSNTTSEASAEGRGANNYTQS